MRIEQLCNLYSQIHFTGALALLDCQRKWELSAVQLSLFIRPKGVVLCLEPPTNTGVEPANNSRKRSLHGLAQRILAASPILYCEKFMDRN